MFAAAFVYLRLARGAAFGHAEVEAVLSSTQLSSQSITYDHTYQRTRDPVRSPIDKLVRGGLVVGSVTTSESPLLYVFCPWLPLLFDRRWLWDAETT